MSKLIIVVAGKKQSGKNTFALEVASQFAIARGRKTWVQHPECELRDVDSLQKLNVGPDDTSDASAVGVRLHSFADSLKNFAVETLGLGHHQVWGTDLQKQSLTNIKWESLPREYRRNGSWTGSRRGRMTARQVLQIFGTDICRSMDPDCWARSTYRRAVASPELVSVICDARFPNEVQYSKFVGADDAVVKLVRLMRSPLQDSHISESSIDDVPITDFDYVLGKDSTILHYANAVHCKLRTWVTEATRLQRSAKCTSET
jgi:hypothetical protein